MKGNIEYDDETKYSTWSTCIKADYSINIDARRMGSHGEKCLL